MEGAVSKVVEIIGSKDIEQILILHCCECGQGIDVPVERLKIEQLTSFLAAASWLVSIVSPMGVQPVRFALLCPDCTRRVHPPAVVDLAKRHLKKGIS
jgi:uncharacterized protein YlaI